MVIQDKDLDYAECNIVIVFSSRQVAIFKDVQIKKNCSPSRIKYIYKKKTKILPYHLSLGNQKELV